MDQFIRNTLPPNYASDLPRKHELDFAASDFFIEAHGGKEPRALRGT